MISKVKLHDLSHPIFHNCPGWPDYAPTCINHDYRGGIHGFNAETMSLNTHTSTHIDVPFHFYDQGETIDRMPLESFAGPGVFLDLRPMEPDSVIDAERLKPFADRIEPGEIDNCLMEHPGVRAVCTVSKRERLIAYCKAQDLEVAEIYVDGGYTGSNNILRAGAKLLLGLKTAAVT